MKRGEEGQTEISTPTSTGSETDKAEADTLAGLRRTIWIVGALAIILVVIFDLGPPLAFNDDWIYAWNVQHFQLLHPHFYPFGTALALIQTVWAWLVTFGHTDQRLLRLSIVPFVLLAMYTLHRLSKKAGADKTWSAIAAVSPLTLFVFTADATTFMTDVPYVALLLMAALGAVNWSQGRKWIGICVLFAILTTLQRQTGVMIPVAITIVLLWRRRTLRMNPDGVGLVLLWVGVIGAVVLPTASGLTPHQQSGYITAVFSPNPVYLLTDLLFLPGMIGLGLILFLPGLLLCARRRAKVDRTRLLVLAVAVWELLVLARAGDLFPGNVFTIYGFNSAESIQGKPFLFPVPLYLGVEIAALSALMLFLWRWRAWWPNKTGSIGTLLIVLSITQFLPLAFVQYLAFDRYYLPVILLLVPLAARAASQATRPVLAVRLALVLSVVSIGLYAIGEQDYQAWQVARNHAACLAYQYALPIEVNAGYEANAVYGEVPYYERTGVIFGGLPVPGQPDFTVYGPADPVISIEFAGFNDPRPGYNYSSLASGKLILVPGPKGVTLDIKVPTDNIPQCQGGG